MCILLPRFVEARKITQWVYHFNQAQCNFTHSSARGVLTQSTTSTRAYILLFLPRSASSCFPLALVLKFYSWLIDYFNNRLQFLISRNLLSTECNALSVARVGNKNVFARAFSAFLGQLFFIRYIFLVLMRLVRRHWRCDVVITTPYLKVT